MTLASALLELGPGPSPMVHDVGPMSYGHALCPMALSTSLVLSLVSLVLASISLVLALVSLVLSMALSRVLWPCISHAPCPCPMSHGPVLF